MKKVVLVSKSQGERGKEGKKKIYEIILEGNRVTISWGKAEAVSRQSQTHYFANEWKALNFAEEKKWLKLGKGYELAFTA